ncbi:OsmC family protein [Bacillus sp. 1P06AnD]|uniref:OsmC family protein n=1 Tax=Bacillus sp. 1P06AnD TaxID=3132208 RepID=UPI0039A3F1AB
MKFTYQNEKVNSKLKFDDITISTNAENGYLPFELFVSSLTGCSSSLLARLLTKKRISFDKINVEVTSARNPDEANRIEQLAFEAEVISNKAMTEQQREQLAHLVIKNCGMIQSVVSSIDISFTIQFRSEPN